VARAPAAAAAVEGEAEAGAETALERSLNISWLGNTWATPSLDAAPAQPVLSRALRHRASAASQLNSSALPALEL
jgi:hypothetical protein